MVNYLKIVAVLVLMSACLMLASCTQTEKVENKPDIESIVGSFEHPETKQKFKIVNAYELYQNYTDRVESNPNHSQVEIYKEEVIDPVYSDCIGNGEYFYMADQFLNVTPDDLMKNQLLSEKIDREETENTIKEALFKSSNLLRSEKETTVCVLPATDVNQSGVTLGAGKIILLYNEYYTDEVIRSLIAHEYHHSVWTEKYQSKNGDFTVLDNLIFEGKAVKFEQEVYPELDLTIVDLTYNKFYWSKIEEDLDKSDLNRSLEITMGGNGLPYSYGYSEGYKMVKSYLDLNPNLTPEEWLTISSKEIFEKGNYLENYQ